MNLKFFLINIINYQIFIINLIKILKLYYFNFYNIEI